MGPRLRVDSRLSVFCTGLLLCLTLACSNPVSRFTKQYKCQIPDKPEPRTGYEYVDRGMEHARRGEMECALGACAEAIRLDAKLPTAYACRGAALNNKGDYLKALEDFNSALELQPGNGDFYHSRAQIHGKLDQMDEALADATKASELITSEFGRSVAFAFRGSLYKKQQKFETAIKDYDQAIRLAPDFAYHFANRGEVYAELKDFDKAIADYNRAISLDKGNHYFLRNRASAYRAINRYDLAKQDDLAADALASGPQASDETPTPPKDSGSETEVKEPLAGGDLKGLAISLPKPSYPPVAKSVRAWGLVVVEVRVDEEGKVVSANAVAGHPLLRPACVAASRESTFKPSGRSVNGTVRYEFELK